MFPLPTVTPGTALTCSSPSWGPCPDHGAPWDCLILPPPLGTPPIPTPLLPPSLPGSPL